MFESRISVGATENLPRREKSHAKTVAWSYDMEGARCKVSRSCLDRHFKKEELESVGQMSKVCAKIFLKC